MMRGPTVKLSRWLVYRFLKWYSKKHGSESQNCTDSASRLQRNVGQQRFERCCGSITPRSLSRVDDLQSSVATASQRLQLQQHSARDSVRWTQCQAQLLNQFSVWVLLSPG